MRSTVLALLAMLLGASSAHAQEVVFGNQFIRAHVVTASNAGRFWITTGSIFRDPVRFLYGTDATWATSNIVFRVSRGTSVTYFSNLPDSYINPGGYPTTPSGSRAVFRPYDSLKVSGDTLRIYWNGLSGYNVVMRFIPEKRRTIYDNGGDMLIEFSYSLQPFAPMAELGILMMLDTYNSQAFGDAGGQGDKSSIITTSGYYPAGSTQYNPTFTKANMPAWYHVGNFLLNNPLNEVFPIHRLTGVSHNGDSLTPPDLFAIGAWPYMKYIAWDLPASHYSSNFEDVATIVRWESLAGEGTVRTAFGLSDKQGNNNFTCRDDNLFVDISAPRLITQEVKNGPYSQSEFDVEMWVSNTSETTASTPTIRLQTPINSWPSFPVPGNRLILDAAATRADTQVFIGPRKTVKLRWRLKVNPASSDTLAQLNFFVRKNANALERRFLDECAPLITIKGWQEPPPPPDTLAPRIELSSFARAESLTWTFSVYDRHPGYAWDLGLADLPQLISSENMSFTTQIPSFAPCDTTRTVGVITTVTDTSLPASATFRAVDCAGNDSIATISYSPRPDTFPPEEYTRRSGGLGDCNSRHYDITLVDSTHQYPEVGDHGFGNVVLIYADNFRVVVNGGAPIEPFQKAVTVVADVIDSMKNGGFALRVWDFEDNEMAVTYGYCTRFDTKPPDTLIVPLGAGRYGVTVSDRRAWDRGLRRIDEVSNLGGNMRIVQPPAITVGDPVASFVVEAIDPSMPGELILDAIDSVAAFVSDPENHVTRMIIRHTPGVAPPSDTIAPDITFAPASGSNGASVITTVDEIHFVDGARYAYDTGIEAIWVESSTPNIRLASAISFISGDTVTTFNIQVIDTLIIGVRDSIVIGARDRAGNVRYATYAYPIRPDTLAPIFTGSMSADRTTITATLGDERQYDRGLGSIALEDGVNVAMRGSAPNIRGRAREIVRFDVTDPDAPVSGTFVLSDLIGVLDQAPEKAAGHIVRLPFSLPSVALEIGLPELVGPGEPVVAALVARTAIGADVDSLGFDVRYVGAKGQPVVRWLIGGVNATPSAGALRVMLVPGAGIAPGDTIGTITFGTHSLDQAYALRVTIADASVNGGVGRDITVSVAGDTARSILSLPPALMRVTGDSVTYVNGLCQQILTTGRQPAKPNALAILGIRPQPIVRSGGTPLELDLRNVPAEGARAELVALDGTVAAQATIDGAGEAIVRRQVRFAAVPQGSYVLRLSASSGVDHVMVVVVD